MTTLNWLCAAGVGCASFITAVASADFVNPDVPTWRGTSSADFYGWETFTSAFGGPNLPNYAGTESAAALFNFGGGALITGTGNLYGAGGPLSISIYGGLTGAVSEVVLNLSTVGTGVNLSSVRFSIFDNNGSSVALAPTSTELRSDTPAPGGQGQIQTWAMRWVVAPLALQSNRFVVDFGSTTVNMSLDAVALDIHAVPAPGVAALMGLAGLFTKSRRRRS